MAILRENGWDIVRVSDILPVNAGDEQVLEKARAEGRVVVSHDLDFSTLVAVSGHARPSLLILRLTTADPQAVARRLLHVLPLHPEGPVGFDPSLCPLLSDQPG